MPNRRQFFVAVLTTAGLAPVVAWVAQPGDAGRESKRFPFRQSEAQWRARLDGAQYHVLRERGTEWAFSSPLDHELRAGTYTCAGCGRAVFASSAKFDSGTGWPSFFQPIDGAVETSVDRRWFMVRTEVHCANCGSHLGHVFPDGPRPTGLRYCINGVALRFATDARAPDA
jgi:peptide-methionine (R)-S-oxide reductase